MPSTRAWRRRAATASACSTPTTGWSRTRSSARSRRSSGAAPISCSATCSTTTRPGAPLFRIRGDPHYARAIDRGMPDVNHPTLLARREVYERVGGFDPALRFAMDYDWLLRAHRAGFRGDLRAGGRRPHDARRRVRSRLPAGARRGPRASRSPWRAGRAGLAALSLPRRQGHRAAGAARGCAGRALRASSGGGSIRATSPIARAAGVDDAARSPAAAEPVFDRSLERLLCVLVVAGAVKIPLGIPLYLNAALLLLGLFSLVVLQALPRLFLWMIGLIGLGAIAAWQLDILADSGPRLAQLFLILLATALIARLDPDLLAPLSRPAAAGDAARDGGRAAAAGAPVRDARALRHRRPAPGRAARRAELQRHAVRRGRHDPGPASAALPGASRPCSPRCRASVAA